MEISKKIKIVLYFFLIAGISFAALGLVSWKSNNPSKHVQSTSIRVDDQVPEENPPSNFEVDLDSVKKWDITFGAGKQQRLRGKNYEYKLSEKYQITEHVKYSFEEVDRQVKAALKAISEPYINYTTDFANAVYNLVQAFKESNESQIVAWRTPNDLVEKDSGEYALIYIEGGPISDFNSRTFRALAESTYWRGFILNEAQFGMFPRQMVGKRGVRAQGNYYMDKLRGKDKQFLADYKRAYDEGYLSDTALFWALAGTLDLNLVRLFAATSLAADIVASARALALVEQLRSENYERISLVGLSYGFPLGLQMLLINPELIELLYKISLGENVVTDWYNVETLARNDFALPNLRDPWNRFLFDFGDLYNTTRWITSMLNGPQGADFKRKTTVHNAIDDDVIEKRSAKLGLTEKWKANQKFWHENGVHYHAYLSGGHSVWFSKSQDMAAVVGLQPEANHYWAVFLNEELEVRVFLALHNSLWQPAVVKKEEIADS